MSERGTGTDRTWCVLGVPMTTSHPPRSTPAQFVFYRGAAPENRRGMTPAAPDDGSRPVTMHDVPAAARTQPYGDDGKGQLGGAGEARWSARRPSPRQHGVLG